MNGFLHWWQNLPLHISPYIFEVGSFRVGWYGMMYVVAFTVFYLISNYRVTREGRYPSLSKELIQDYILWAALGLVIGARVGYVLFYNLGYYMENPLEIILPYDFNAGRYTGISGMSYHGGFVGTFLASAIFFRKRGLSFLRFADVVIPGIPLGYVFGRLGNFINGELYGRVTDVPWGMHFPSASLRHLRHPSQLYEALGEGVLLFLILWPMRNSRRMRGLMFPVYIAGYGIVRFVIEFFRQPDEQLGFVAGPLSMGQMLCIGMVVAAIALGIYQRRIWDRLAPDEALDKDTDEAAP